MLHPNPNKFTSIQQYLEALRFTTNSDYFVCDDIRFLQVEISGGFTPATFAAKMRARGRMPEEGERPIKWPFA